MDLKAPKKSKVGKCSSHLSIESRLHLCAVIAISRTLLKEWFPLKKRDNCPKQVVFISATIAYIFFSSTAIHIYDFHMFTVIYSPPCGFIWTKHNNQLPVGLLAQFVERCTGHGFKSRTGLNLFRSYFHNYLISVYNCEDRFLIRFFNCSSRIWFSHIFIYSVCIWIVLKVVRYEFKQIFRTFTLLLLTQFLLHNIAKLNSDRNSQLSWNVMRTKQLFVYIF